ncbi:MAG: signal peptide peptidase SppA [Candidatus Eisenbacteria bacterium]
MKAFIRNFLASLLAFVVFLLVLLGAGAAALSGDEVKIDDHSYLLIDMYGEITEYDPPGGVMAELLGGSPLTLQRVLTAFDLAAEDDRIDGVILKLSAANTLGGGMIDEIRAAVTRFRQTGKPVYGWGDSINRKTFTLAAACDSIFMPRTAYIDFMGIGLTSTHVKKTLQKLGVEPNLHKIKDYKSAAEMVTREDLSEAAKENYRWLIDGYWASTLAILSEDRGLDEAEVTALMEHALFTTEEAVEAGLVDRALYWDGLEEMLKGEEDDELRTVSLSDYAEVDPADLGRKGKKKIVVIHAQGTIAGRKSKVDPMLGVVMGHETVVADLREAREDDDVAAIVFRVDSGGGEALASDLMGHEVEVTTGVKPVVVSMVDVAASGGYHISYRGTRILADPNSITGSIGSISGKFNIKGFHDKIGITHDFVEKGPMAFLYSDQRNFTDDERARFEENHWEGFNDWLRDVADHRGMTFEEAEKLAHGRVWSGTQAAENGLIDEVGDLNRAIALAKELGGVPEDEEVTIVHLPEKKGLVDSILEGDFDLAAVARIAAYRLVRQELVDTWRGLLSGPTALMDPVEID